MGSLRAVVLLLVATAACGRHGFGPTADAAVDGAAVTDAPSPASCVGLAASCGPSAASACCESPLVVGGSFARSYDVATDGMFQDASFGATISELRLDRYEVTVGRFRQFVGAGQGTQSNPPLPAAGLNPLIAGTGWDASWNLDLATTTIALIAAVKCLAAYETWTDAPGGTENRPMVCVTWYEAMAFCAWDGGFLPTEAQWNFAAAGGDEQRAYPWSSPPGQLTIDSSHASWNCTGDGALGCTPADLVVVGSDPAGDARWGQSDLAGNATEWTLDWKRTPYASPCVDCAELDASLVLKVFRGGSWGDASFNMRGAHRGSVAPPIVRQFDRGFRCARSP